ncbi:MAG: DUF1302 domain-containing protein [Deltaproteobacteria bacterium]|nr:DUF1302 domain-containing protein [Deltaproteobacteria bacterium]
MMWKLVGSYIARSVSVLAFCSLLLPGQAGAIDLSSGEVEASLDTTLSYGVTFRVAERDEVQITKTNDNDGNLNYDRGVVSNAFKFTSELDIGYQNLGLFVRASGLYDIENENGTRARTPLSDEAKALIGTDLDVLDAYVTGAFDLGDATLDVRLGNHVLNWGESTFIQNGVNAVNPFDVSKLRVPGSELREALLAVPLVSASVAGNLNLTMEGFYQIGWEKTEIDPVGSFFSVTDYVGPGASNAVIALPGLNLGDMGLTADPATNPFLVFSRTSVASAFAPLITADRDFLIASRDLPDRDPRDSGQWGAAFRYLAEGLNNTEFGFYFMNYHSRLPVVSARTGTAQDAGRGLAAAGAIGAAAPTAVGEIVTGAVMQAMAAAQCPSPAHSPECGALAQRVQAETTALATGLAGGAAQAAGIDAYAKNGYYFIEYPEDIQLYGVSFNTTLGTTGWALQGEYSYRRDAPLQFAERKIFADALGPFTGLPGCIVRKVQSGVPQALAGPQCIGENAAAGRYGAENAGYVLSDVSQVQATATKVFGPVMGADGGAFVTEVAMMQVHDMPSGKGVAAEDLTPADRPLESPAGSVGEGPSYDPNDADATSWGYRLAARLDYNQAIGAVNLFPYLRFGHDVGGNSPAPSGSFVEGRTALTLGLAADYLSRWQFDVSYTQYAGSRNSLRDRDFVTATVKYSF